MPPREPEPPLLCDDCGGRALSVHILPDGATPKDVRMACHHHDPGGESWLLTEEAELNQLWDKDTLLDRLRPGLTDKLPFTALDPTSFWDDTREPRITESRREQHTGGLKITYEFSGQARSADSSAAARRTPNVTRPRQVGAVGSVAIIAASLFVKSHFAAENALCNTVIGQVAQSASSHVGLNCGIATFAYQAGELFVWLGLITLVLDVLWWLWVLRASVTGA